MSSINSAAATNDADKMPRITNANMSYKNLVSRLADGDMTVRKDNVLTEYVNQKDTWQESQLYTGSEYIENFPERVSILELGNYCLGLMMISGPNEFGTFYRISQNQNKPISLMFLQATSGSLDQVYKDFDVEDLCDHKNVSVVRTKGSLDYPEKVMGLIYTHQDRHFIAYFRFPPSNEQQDAQATQEICITQSVGAAYYDCLEDLLDDFDVNDLVAYGHKWMSLVDK
jgi:hypothetical protein